MGVGATNVEARVAASLGQLVRVAPEFQAAADVPFGGVLWALPAVLALGLIDTSAAFLRLPAGYYGLDSVLLLLVFMALARLSSIESLRFYAPGEWGKLLGLDRAPEVRTLREKVRLLADEGKPEPWGGALCERWMQSAPDEASLLYIDGHVRIYHGAQTQLPRHYVARQRLCLRATTDYWVNAMDGQPFLVVNQAIDPGLIKVIEQEILPRLAQAVPGQPSEARLAAEPRLHRFTLVFDREGYSPDLLQRMKAQRVACLTYHKFPGPDWALEEFATHRVALASGEVVQMQLAERGSCLRNQLWVREIRKLTQRGHQTAILATDYRSNLVSVAVAMFARWSQENYFKYAREHYGLDRLVDYRTELIPDPTQVVNPAYRQLDGKLRSSNAKLHRRLAEFGAFNLWQPIEPQNVEPFMQKKAALQEQIEALQAEVKTLKDQRKATPHHIAVKDLPDEERFRRLSTHAKHLLDTIKMLAYRAESAMANVLREHLAHPAEARTLLRALYATEADLLPDYQERTLTVRLHHMPQRCTDVAIQKLCDELNATETLFPRTNLRLIFKLGAA